MQKNKSKSKIKNNRDKDSINHGEIIFNKTPLLSTALSKLKNTSGPKSKNIEPKYA